MKNQSVNVVGGCLFFARVQLATSREVGCFLRLGGCLGGEGGIARLKSRVVHCGS